MLKRNLTIVKPQGYDIEYERRQLAEFFEKNELEIDPEFFTQINPGDIIEVYSIPDNRQIFCNSEFSKICSYTKEQMTTIPFPDLFWRSEEDNVAIIQRASHVALYESKCVRWNIANHDLVESLHPKKRTFEMELGCLSTCFDIKTKARRGFASTLKVNLIFEWEENLN